LGEAAACSSDVSQAGKTGPTYRGMIPGTAENQALSGDVRIVLSMSL